MKFVKVNYGSTENDDKGFYVYLANDNVRVGDIVQPTFTHKTKDGTGKLCVTTAVIRGASKVGAKGETQEEMMDIAADAPNGNIKRIFTGADLGVQRQRDAKGRIVKDSSYHDDEGNYVVSAFDSKVRTQAKERTVKEGFIDLNKLVDAMNAAKGIAKTGPQLPKTGESAYTRVQTKEVSGAIKHSFLGDSEVIKPFTVPVPPEQLKGD